MLNIFCSVCMSIMCCSVCSFFRLLKMWTNKSKTANMCALLRIIVFTRDSRHWADTKYIYCFSFLSFISVKLKQIAIPLVWDHTEQKQCVSNGLKLFVFAYVRINVRFLFLFVLFLSDREWESKWKQNEIK